MRLLHTTCHVVVSLVSHKFNALYHQLKISRSSSLHETNTTLIIIHSFSNFPPRTTTTTMRGRYIHFVCFSLALPHTTLAYIERFYYTIFTDYKSITNVTADDTYQCENALTTGIIQADAFLIRSEGSVHSFICEFIRTTGPPIFSFDGLQGSIIVDDPPNCSPTCGDDRGCCAGYQCINIGTKNIREMVCKDIGSTLIDTFIGLLNKPPVNQPVATEKDCSLCPSTYTSYSYDTQLRTCSHLKEITLIRVYTGYNSSKCTY